MDYFIHNPPSKPEPLDVGCLATNPALQRDIWNQTYINVDPTVHYDAWVARNVLGILILTSFFCLYTAQLVWFAKLQWTGKYQRLNERSLPLTIFTVAMVYISHFDALAEPGTCR